MAFGGIFHLKRYRDSLIHSFLSPNIYCLPKTERCILTANYLSSPEQRFLTVKVSGTSFLYAKLMRKKSHSTELSLFSLLPIRYDNI